MAFNWAVVHFRTGCYIIINVTVMANGLYLYSTFLMLMSPQSALQYSLFAIHPFTL